MVELVRNVIDGTPPESEDEPIVSVVERILNCLDEGHMVIRGCRISFVGTHMVIEGDVELGNCGSSYRE
jgi:hypothetical protein